MPQGLPWKLRHVIQRQALLGGLAIVVGVYAIGLFVANRVAVERLELEADSYLASQAADPAFPLPRGLQVSAWYVPDASSGHPRLAGDLPPDAIRALPPGVGRLDDGRRILVRDADDGRLYLAMSFALMERVATLTGVATTLFALAVLFITAWRTHRAAQRMVSPVDRLAQAVAQWHPGTADMQALEPFAVESSREVSRLVAALRGLGQRTREFVQRERDFTRDASHELRTPLTVVRVAVDMLRSDPAMPAHAERSLLRIQRAGQDMEALVDAFLILAREQGIAPISEEFDVREIVEEQVEKARPRLRDKAIDLRIVGTASPRLHAPPRVLAVMLDHLLQNAADFTEAGSVEVEVGEDRIVIRDTGIGMSPEVLGRVHEPFYRADQFQPSGKGIGLNIVYRLGDRFGWPVELDSIPGEGTRATIRLRSVQAA